MNEYNKILNKINRITKLYGYIPKRLKLSELKKPNQLSIKKAERILKEVQEINRRINSIVRDCPKEVKVELKKKIRLSEKEIPRVKEKIKKLRQEEKKKKTKLKKGEGVKKKRRHKGTKKETKYPDYSDIIINNFNSQMKLIFSHNPAVLDYINYWFFSMLDNYGKNKLSKVLEKAKSDYYWPDWEDVSNTSRVRGKLSLITELLEVPRAEWDELLDQNDEYEEV